MFSSCLIVVGWWSYSYSYSWDIHKSKLPRNLFLTFLMASSTLYPFVSNALFLLKIFWCFQWIEKGYTGNEWADTAHSEHRILYNLHEDTIKIKGILKDKNCDCILKEILWSMCFPVTFVKIFERAPTSERLITYFMPLISFDITWKQ